MSSIPLLLPADYWQTLQVSKKDIEFLHNNLFESETPKTGQELVGVLIEERIRSERVAQAKKRQSDGKIYLPKENYKDGEHLVFPALDWTKGVISTIRPGVNPQYGEFDVLTVSLEDGSSIHVTAGKWWLPGSEALDDFFLSPDIVISPENYSDSEYFRLAIDHFSSQN